MAKYLWQVNYVGEGLKGLTTTVLMTPEEIDKAVKRAPSYRPPGK